MLDVRALKAQDLRGLSPDALAAAAEHMLQRIANERTNYPHHKRHR